MRTRGVVLAVGLAASAATVGGAATAAGAPMAPARTVGHCAIVAQPTPQSPTTCPSADLAGAHLVGADLAYAVLANADLRGADLSGADLAHAALSGADLSSADLSGADLSHANLRGVELSQATLDSAGLTGADMVGASIDGTSFASTIWNHTVCPDGSLSTRDGNTCVYDAEVLGGEAFSAQSAPATSSPLPGGARAADPAAVVGSGQLPFTGVPAAPLGVLGSGLTGLGLLLVLRPARSKRETPGDTP